MKKTICLLFSLLLLTSCLIVAHAENAATISVGTVSGHAGETVTVPVQISGNPGLVAMRLYIQYDAAKLQLVNAEDKGLFGTGNDYFGNDITENPYTLLWEDALSTSNYTSDGTLAELSFKILEDVPSGTANINLTIDNGSTFNVGLQNVSFTVQNGAVNITKRTQHTVTFLVDGNEYLTAKYHEGETIAVPEAPQKDGYTFKGWTPSVPTTMPAGDQTFTAQFEKNPEPVGKVTGISVNDMTLYYKDGGKLLPKVETQGNADYTVAYNVANSKILSVAEDGTVKTHHWGKTDVAVTVTDTNGDTFTDTCAVEVKCHAWQWLIIILLFGWIWY